MEDDDNPAEGNDGGAGASQKPGKEKDQMQSFGRLKRTVKKLEEENASLKLAEQNRKDADLSEVDRLKKQVADLQGKLTASDGKVREQEIRHKVETALRDAGVKHLNQASKLVDLSGVELDAEGNVTGLKEAVAGLKEDSPFLFGDAPPPNGVGGFGGKPTGGNPKAQATEYTAEMVAKMTPAEFAVFDAKVQAGQVNLAG